MEKFKAEIGEGKIGAGKGREQRQCSVELVKLIAIVVRRGLTLASE